MRDKQCHNHHAHEKCRETGDHPQDIHPWLEMAKQVAVPGYLEVGCVGGSPKLQQAHAHPQCEVVEGSLVAVTHAVLCPNAVVVQFVDAGPARAAVRNSWHLVVFTVLALPRQIVSIEVLVID